MFLEDISGIRCCCWSAPVPGCRAGMSRSRPWHSDLQDTSDSFHGEARCLRDTRRTADLHEICGPAPELSKDPGSCSKLLRSQPLCSATPRVLVWHRDHTRRSCKTVSRMPVSGSWGFRGIWAVLCKKHCPESRSTKEEQSSDAWHFSTQARKPSAVAKAPSRSHLSLPRSIKSEFTGEHLSLTHAKLVSPQGQAGQSSRSKSKS